MMRFLLRLTGFIVLLFLLAMSISIAAGRLV